MDRNALGYAEMKWTDRILPPDARIFLGIRLVALCPRYAMATDWAGFFPALDKVRIIRTAPSRATLPWIMPL
ncbi:MAG: hypothetical protein FJY37_07765 [Betaproteobacteria bacterium]|nr:hypothetical protein [Betaproteobacteria bacterium]